MTDAYHLKNLYQQRRFNSGKKNDGENQNVKCSSSEFVCILILSLSLSL